MPQVLQAHEWETALNNTIALRHGSLASAIALALGLSACGGGESNVRETPPPPPAPTIKPYQNVQQNETFTIASGQVFDKRIQLSTWSVLDNAGTVSGDLDVAVNTISENSTVFNHDGGRIEANLTAIALGRGSIVRNIGIGSTIQAGEHAIKIEADLITVENTEGATITSGGTAIQIQNGSITNGTGSTIATTGVDSGDCAADGACSIYIPSLDSGPQRFTLENAGTIVGNVQLNPFGDNKVHLFAGSVIRGDLQTGVKAGWIILDGMAGTVQRYSDAVTGTTEHGGSFMKQGEGTWIIDAELSGIFNEYGAPGGVTVVDGILQVGDGGTEGTTGQGRLSLSNGDLVFNRSDDVLVTNDVHGGEYDTADGAFVQAGTGTLTVASGYFNPPAIRVERGILRFINGGSSLSIQNDSVLMFDGGQFSARIRGSGEVVIEGNSIVSVNDSTYTGGTTVNSGILRSPSVVTGNVLINPGGTFKGTSTYYSPLVSGVAGNLVSSGMVQISEGQDTVIGGNYTQASSGTLSIPLGNKLEVAGSATLDGGTLFVGSPIIGYVANHHTEVLTAGGGVFGTFENLVKRDGMVFTSNTIHYDANSVWLDTTGLNVTLAAAGDGVAYTPVSMASAQRVQGAFDQLDAGIAAGGTGTATGEFMHSAGAFQQAPTLQSAQASLKTLAGQLHASGPAMTFQAIDSSTQALSSRFDELLGSGGSIGMWTRSLDNSGVRARTGFDGVGFNLEGWLVGLDVKLGDSAVAGFAFGESRGQQYLDTGLEQEQGRNSEGVLYAGWIGDGWYAQGHLGIGHFDREVARQLLLGTGLHGVQTRYTGGYSVAYGESGMRMPLAEGTITPFASMEYAHEQRDGFFEAGAGGFGLRSNAQAVERWQAGMGIRADHGWRLSGDRALEVSARALWRRTLASTGIDFDASFVGLEQWQPLVGLGMSRSSGLFDLGMEAWISARTSLKVSYSYETSDRGDAQMLSARLGVAF